MAVLYIFWNNKFFDEIALFFKSVTPLYLISLKGNWIKASETVQEQVKILPVYSLYLLAYICSLFWCAFLAPLHRFQRFKIYIYICYIYIYTYVEIDRQRKCVSTPRPLNILSAMKLQWSVHIEFSRHFFTSSNDIPRDVSKPAIGDGENQSKAWAGQICIKFNVTTHRNSSDLEWLLCSLGQRTNANFLDWLKCQIKTQT